MKCGHPVLEARYVGAGTSIWLDRHNLAAGPFYQIRAGILCHAEHFHVWYHASMYRVFHLAVSANQPGKADSA